jgi:TRAP-type C4-dicarboxylate transport system substrate-binding protein
MEERAMARLHWVLFLASFLPASAAHAQEVKLKANLQVPVSNPFYGVSLVRFKEEVERRSNNALAVEIFDNAQLYQTDQVIDALSSGAIDIGVTTSFEYAKRVAAVAILDQPFLFNFAALVRAAAGPESELRKLIDEAILAKTGVRVLWWQSGGETLFFSNAEDVGDPERIKGRRVAVTGKANAEIVSRCGGESSMVPIEKIEGAIREGSLDMAVLGVSAIQGRGLWKATKKITRTAHSVLEFFLGINERTWQSLSPGHRATLAEAARVVERETRERLAEIESKTYAFASSKGMRVHDLTPDQVAEWRACSAEMLAGYMAEHGIVAQQLMAAYVKLRTDPCCMSTPSSAVFTRR